MSAPEFVLFVSSVQDRTVYRFGTRQLIGAKRVYDPPLRPDEDPATRSVVTKWQPERIVPITANEFQRYGAEYRGAIADGALKERKREEYQAQRDEEARTEAAALAAAKAKSEQPKAATP